jgi:hypothetical protein
MRSSFRIASHPSHRKGWLDWLKGRGALDANAPGGVPGELSSALAHLSFANIRFVINLFLLYGEEISKLAGKRSAALRYCIRHIRAGGNTKHRTSNNLQKNLRYQ